jgi:hypothetical protein
MARRGYHKTAIWFGGLGPTAVHASETLFDITQPTVSREVAQWKIDPTILMGDIH